MPGCLYRICYQRIYTYDTQRHACGLAIPKCPEILQRLQVFDLETYPEGGDDGEMKGCLLVALFEEQCHGHFCKIVFSVNEFERSDAKACAIPGYFYFDYLPQSLSNMIVLPTNKRLTKGPKQGQGPHFTLGTPSMLAKSYVALREQYVAYQANLEKHSHLSPEILNDPTVQYLLYLCQDCFVNSNCVSQYGGR